MYDVIVIGGGIIGLSIAREIAGRKSVLLLDRGATGQGTSRAAAGMLTPLSEADDQGPFFQLCRTSLAMYDPFIEELTKESGLDLAYSTEGLLALASSKDSAATLCRRYEWQRLNLQHERRWQWIYRAEISHRRHGGRRSTSGVGPSARPQPRPDDVGES